MRAEVAELLTGVTDGLAAAHQAGTSTCRRHDVDRRL
jgi:hypothetical protein